MSGKTHAFDTLSRIRMFLQQCPDRTQGRITEQVYILLRILLFPFYNFIPLLCSLHCPSIFLHKKRLYTGGSQIDPYIILHMILLL